MNTPLTELAYILDRSGSMQPMQEAAVAAFNDFLRSQLDVPGDARLTLVLFDDQYEVPVAGLPIEQVAPLTATGFVPRGSTALLDAIGRTIKDTDERLKKLPADQQPGKVIFAIFTDGLENASRQFTAGHVSDLIALYRTEKQWEFIFLAANQDAIATASQMSLDHKLSSSVESSVEGFRTSGKAIGRKVSAVRKSLSDERLTEQELADLSKPMSDIVQEELSAESGSHEPA
ncbi:MAG: hypothetical protein JNM99_16855 [Verrucomicrobiaceae bacterium]|nr:hypothetical protein [Verrucomicrobiaceae bacterium]